MVRIGNLLVLGVNVAVHVNSADLATIKQHGIQR